MPSSPGAGSGAANQATALAVDGDVSYDERLAQIAAHAVHIADADDAITAAQAAVATAQAQLTGAKEALAVAQAKRKELR